MQQKVNIEIWVENNKGILEFKENRNAIDVFNDIEKYLTEKSLMPDEYFSFSDFDFTENKKFPTYYRIVSYANYGTSEGIYLDVDLYTKDKDNKFKVIHFITGKTLSINDESMDRMYKIACEITKLFGG